MWRHRTPSEGRLRSQVENNPRLRDLVWGLQPIGLMNTKTDELKNRIEARKHELLARLETIKADTRHEAAAARDSIKVKLEELETHLKDGWEKLSDAVKTQLNKWLEPDASKPQSKKN